MKILDNKKIIALVVLLLPVISFAQTFKGIPCDGTVDNPCDYNKLMELVSNIINYIVALALPLAVISIAIAGGKIMLAGESVPKRQAGIKMMWTVVQGFGVLLAAWLIVKAILTVLVNPSYIDSLPIKF